MPRPAPASSAAGLGGMTGLPAATLARLVGTQQVSALEVVQAHLELIGEADGAINAVVHLDGDAARQAARDVDGQARRGESGPLAGVPFLVKDNIDVAGHVTAAGSAAHDDRPAAADAPVVRRLREAGAVLLGRTNMDELAMGASTQTSAHGPTRNPVDRRRSPGGSSGGSAAAVAAGFAPLAVGTDTGGSIREPASQCGVVGVAPSPDLVPLDGVVPFALGHDRVGPMTRTVADASVALAVMSGGRLRRGRSPRRVGIVEELVGPRNRPEVLGAFSRWVDGLRGLDVEVMQVSLPDAPAALAAYMDLTSLAALDWLEERVATGRAGVEVVRRRDLARELRATGAAAVAGAEAVRRRLAEQVAHALRRVDVLCSPTMPTAAPLLAGEITPEALADPLSAPYTDCWTVVANLTGLPALSVPAPVDGLPVGAMLMGRAGHDADLLALASRVVVA